MKWNPLITILLFVFSCSLFAQAQVKKSTNINLFFPQSEINNKVKSLENKSFSLVNSKAKFKIILFWNSWSVSSIPALNELSRRKFCLDKKNCEVFGIIPVSKYINSKSRIEVNKDAVKQDKENVYKLIDKFSINFENGFLEDEELIKNLDLDSLPQVWLITDDGKVLEKTPGYSLKKTFKSLSKTIKKNTKK